MHLLLASATSPVTTVCWQQNCGGCWKIGQGRSSIGEQGRDFTPEGWRFLKLCRFDCLVVWPGDKGLEGGIRSESSASLTFGEGGSVHHRAPTEEGSGRN